MRRTPIPATHDFVNPAVVDLVITSSYLLDALMDLVRAMGFQWLKQQMGWRDIEPLQRGQYDWSRPDDIVDTHDWLRPRLWGGEAAVPVLWDGEGRWNAVATRPGEER